MGKIRWYWTNEEDAQFKEDWESGLPNKDIAEKFSVALSTVTRHAQDLGLKPKRKSKKRRKKR